MSVSFRGWSRDGTHYQHTIVIWVNVPPDTAFAYVEDLTRHHEWAVDPIQITPITPGPVQLGSRYAAVGRQRGKDWPSDLEVTGFEPSRRFEFTATGGPVGTPAGDPHRHEFLFTEENGGTRLEVRRVDPLPPDMPAWLFQWVLAPLVLNYARGHRIQTIERLRQRLDALAHPQPVINQAGFHADN